MNDDINRTSINASMPPHQARYSKIELVLFLITALLILFVVFSLIRARADKTIIITDAQTGNPIEGADIAMEKSWLCTPDFTEYTTYKTNEKGVAKIKKNRFACEIEVSKDGYFPNGISERFSFPFRLKISLQKELYNPQIHASQHIYEGDSVDILNAVVSPVILATEEGETTYIEYEPIKTIIPSETPQKEADFTVKEIKKVKELLNGHYEYQTKIEFTGFGGVREVPASLENRIDGKGSKLKRGMPYDLFNLVNPPEDGYIRELTISATTHDYSYGTKKMFVAKLRDGKTFVKIILHNGTDNNGKGYFFMIVLPFAEYPIIQQVLENYPEESPYGEIDDDSGYSYSVHDKTGEMFTSFAGIGLQLPKEFSIEQNFNKENGQYHFVFDDDVGNSFVVHVKNETYQNFIVNLRRYKILEESFNGFYSIKDNYGSESQKLYTFYDSVTKKSYTFRFYENFNLDWDIKDVFSFLLFQNIQQ